jgi:hypothetical protein
LEERRSLLRRVSGTLAGRADRGNRGEGKLSEHYYFSGNSSPTILVDKEGKIIMTHAMTHGMNDRLKTKLAEIFE